MDFRILGPLEVRRDEAVIALGGPKQRAVLAMLLLRANQPVSAEQLAQALWGDEAPAGAVRTVQVHVSRLRKALGDGDIVATTPAGYCLHVEPGELDAERFERLVDDGRRALSDDRPDDAAAVLGEALTLWRGSPLADFAFERFAQRDIERLEEQRLAAIEVRMEAALAAGRHAELVADLRRLVAEHPTSERLAGLLMLALYRSGRQAEALDAYHDAHRKLADEIGIDPGPELRELQAAVLRHDPSLRLPPPPAELPRELDPVAAPDLAGRDVELAWLRDRWDEARAGPGTVVALAGPRGIGRTRLVAELAREAHGEGARVLYASGPAAIGALGGAHDATRPALVVADDVDGPMPTALRELAHGPTLVVAIAERPAALAGVQPDAALTLEPLDEEAVRAIALTYVHDQPAEDVPASALLHASGGIPRRVHDVARTWARSEAARRVEAIAGPAAAGRAELRSMEEQLVGGIVQLQSTREPIASDEDEGPVICPFKGLASFEADDAPYFFGRERLIAELVARLVGAPLLGVVGPSGSGKSSVVKAGLLPALAAGVLPGSERWPQAVIRPGEHPPRELRAGLDGLAAGGRVVLAVDQFEEAFTACRDEDERAEFFAELVRLARDRRGSTVILTIRADFYGRCAGYPDLSRLLAANHVLVGSLSRDELRQAVVCPAQRAALHVEPELADALVNDVAGEPGALPLLSSALLELWHHREGRRLRIAGYEETGRVRGAVARLAEGAFGRLDEAQQAIARGVLLRLAEIDEEGNVERRRLPLDELDGQEGAVADVIGLLADSRLLTVSEGSVEVAHEALLREWPRLRAWIEEDLDGLRIRRNLTVAAEEWRDLGYDEDMLYRGIRLTEADEWREGHELALNQLERTFLDASDARRASERKARRRRVQRVIAGLAVALAAITAVAIVALYQGREAGRQRDIAASRELAARATSFLDIDPALSLDLAQRALERRDTEQARNVLRQATLASRSVSVWPAHQDWVYVVEPSRDGRQALTAGRDGVVRIQNLNGEPRARSVRAHRGWVLGASLSPDGRMVASAGDDGVVAIWDVASGDQRVILRLGDDYATGVHFNPDGRRLIVSLLDGTARIISATDGETVSVLRGHEGFVWSARFSADGARAVTTDDGSARIWDLSGGPPLVLHHPDIVIGADFSPDGRRVATAAQDGVVRVWDAARGNRLVTIRADDQQVNSVRFSKDGRRLVTAGDEGIVRVWDADGGPALAELRGHRGAVMAAAFVPGTETVISGGEDRTLRRWAPAADAVLLAPANGASFDPDGGRVVSGGLDGAVRIWDVASGSLQSRRGHVDTSVAEYSSDGGRIISASEDSTARIWDAESGTSEVVFSARDRPLFDATFDPSGERIAVSGGFPRIVIQRPDGAERIVLSGHGGVVRDVAFSPDGDRLASAADDGTVRVWDAASGALERTFRGHSESVSTVSYSSDGARVVSAGADGTVRIWDVDGDRSVVLRGHQGSVSSAAFDPSGDRVVSAGQDGTVRVWSAAGGETLVTLYRYQGPAHSAEFSADGRRVVSAGEPGLVRVSTCEVCGSLSEVLRLARTRAQRRLSAVEQEQLLPRED